jgi:hypothetical protein
MRKLILAAFLTCALVVPATAGGAITVSGGGIGGGGDGGATVPGATAKLKRNGQAIAPEQAPPRVKAAIAAANKIDSKPYILGGGHGGWGPSRGYDCSGAVSYTLGPNGADILKSPIPSGSFKSWGKKGRGKWITVYADAGHVFVVIAGLRFDTSMPDDGDSGPGWSKNVSDGFRNVSRDRARTYRGF